MFEAKIVLDTKHPSGGRRLITAAITYPRFIHAEFMTHRDRARNAASSRAIPWPTMMSKIMENPVVPIRFGSEQKGMQTGGEVENPEAAERVWLQARDDAVHWAQKLADLGVHKSICNRITEPWMWIEVVTTATEWKNLFRLRCHPDAEIHFQKIAGMLRDAIEASTPRDPLKVLDVVPDGNGMPHETSSYWHLPYVVGAPDENDLVGTELSIDELCKISVARCARVSYLTHDGVRDPEKDIGLFDRLVQGSGFGHFSPHEHVACAASLYYRSGPFVDWHQFRKSFPLENVEG